MTTDAEQIAAVLDWRKNVAFNLPHEYDGPEPTEDYCRTCAVLRKFDAIFDAASHPPQEERP